MATWEPVPQADTEQRPVSRWSDDNDTPMAATHNLAAYIPPYKILERFRESPVFSSRNSGHEKDKGTVGEAVEDLLQRLRGWRTGLVLCTLVCALIFGLNVATTVLSVLRMVQDGGGDNDAQRQQQRQPAGLNNQVVTFYQGDCVTTRNFSIALRLVINILATILLACANYCMQILVSPTRGELDLVHRQKRWLWVGVPNLSNLPHIGLNRAAICVLLMISTLPLHVLWNAALVETISANDYYVGGVTEDFFSSGANFSTTSPEKLVPGWFQGSRKSFEEVWFRAMRGSGVTNLTAADCIRAYGSPTTELYGNVALIFGTLNETNSFLFAGTRLVGADDGDAGASVGFGSSWVCGLPAPTSPACDYHSLADKNGTSWAPLSNAAGWSALASADPYMATLAQANVPVKYCMAQQTVAADGSPVPSSASASCRLASLPILQYAVLCTNALLLLCLVGTWFAVRRRGDGKHEGHEHIVTSGDLIASYLRDPDLRFAGRCLASARMVTKAKRQRNVHARPRRRRRRGSATTQRAQVDGAHEQEAAAVDEMEEAGDDEEDTNVGFWNSSQPMPLPWNGRSRRRTTVLGYHEKAGFMLEPPGGKKARHRLSQLGCFGQPPDEAETRMMEEQGRKTAPRWHTGVPGFFVRLMPPIFVVLAIIGLFFGFRLEQQNLSLAAGFGQPSVQAVAGFPARLSSSNWGAAATALVANTPQLLGAYVYLTCNAALTAMLAHAEVSRFAVRRGGLRVSYPRPDTAQRSSFHLHLPLHVSLPLLMGCAALHWLLGESLFLLRVAAYDGLLRSQVQDPATLSPRAVMAAVGYSAILLLATAGLLALLVGVMLAVGWFRRYMGAERMPLFATCSASLAAATCPTSSFFFPQVVTAGSGYGNSGGKTAGGRGERAAMEPAAVERQSRIGSWVEAVGLTTGMAPAVGLAHGHPSRDELGVISTPDPIAGSYAYYRVRRFEEKLSEHGLAWGTVDDSEPVHHATFSLGPVLPLEKGQFYA